MANYGIHAQLPSHLLSQNALLKTNKEGNFHSSLDIYPSTKNVWSASTDTQSSFIREPQKEQNFNFASFTTNCDHMNETYHNNYNFPVQQTHMNINLLPL
jgi:hypothetical protein